MKTPKLILFLGISFLFVSTASVSAGQQTELPCRVPFAVRFGLVRWGLWPADAKKWWVEEGKKKFPELCETQSKDAEFVLSWEEKLTKDKDWEALQELDRDRMRGGIERPGDSDEGIAGARSPLPAPQGEGHVALAPLEPVSEMIVTVYRAGAGGDEIKVKSIRKKLSYPLEKPGKDSFRSALKAIRKEAQKAGGTKTK